MDVHRVDILKTLTNNICKLQLEPCYMDSVAYKHTHVYIVLFQRDDSGRVTNEGVKKRFRFCAMRGKRGYILR